MLRRRVIPCLDVADGRVVKGTRFVDLLDEGDPPELAERYAREGADELVFLDISAAPEGRGTLLDIVERTARRAFVPLTVGGGVRSVEDMRDVLRAGADKVSLNTRAVADPELVTAVRGAVRQPGRRGGHRRPARGARRRRPSLGLRGGRQGRPRDPGLDAVAWAARAVELGAGELLVTSIDRDGTGSGFDTDLLRAISSRVPVPVIASGGAAGPADFVAAVRDGGADAVLAAVDLPPARGLDRGGQGGDGGRGIPRPRDRSGGGGMTTKRDESMAGPVDIGAGLAPPTVSWDARASCRPSSRTWRTGGC